MMMSSQLPTSTAGSEPASICGEETVTAAVEPPNRDSALSITFKGLKLADTQTDTTDNGLHPTYGSSFPPPSHLAKLHAPTPSYHYSGNRLSKQSSMHISSSIDSHASADTFISVPASPSMSEGLTDSPGSVSSMNSFRRGDLADIEDLDLEPELETVSERDEESSSLCSMDLADSDSELTSNNGVESDHPSLGLGLAPHGLRSTSVKAFASGSPASDYARRKRSEWYLNNYANKIAARRPRKVKKGRISEIVEEGGDINTTVMPKPASACVGAEWTCEVSGPPVQPPRSVSPSDTVPVVPSPLSECLSVEANASGQAMEDSVETVRAPSSVNPPPDPSLLSVPDQGAVELADKASEPDSPPRSRMPRRASSPPPLRPCFRRRSSAQSAASTRESSCERESVRGRSVRFSVNPPQEMRTHSPVDYDRKSCPINNRLSPEDVEELRTMKMEMGLLEAKWAAVAACKLSGSPVDCRLSDAAHNAGIAAMKAARNGNDDLGAESDSAARSGSQMTPAARVRLQKEKEREQERQRNMPKYNAANLPNRGGKVKYDCDSVRAKFGHAPPPPLPGTTPCVATRSVSPRSSSAPPINRTPSEERAFQALLTRPSLPDGSPAASASSCVPTLTATSPSPPRSPVDSISGYNPSRRPSNPALVPHDSHLMVNSYYGSPARGRQPGPSFSSFSSVKPLPTPSSTSSASSSRSPPRPANMPASWTPPCASPTKAPSLPSYPSIGSFGSCDGPTSDYYESGSEYDLIG